MFFHQLDLESPLSTAIHTPLSDTSVCPNSMTECQLALAPTESKGLRLEQPRAWSSHIVNISSMGNSTISLSSLF